MTCNSDQKNVIVKGEDKTLLFLHLLSDGRALDLTSKTVNFKLKIGGVLTTVAGAITVAEAGEATLTLTDVQTLDLATGILNVDSYVDDGGDLTIVQFYNQIEVKAALV